MFAESNPMGNLNLPSTWKIHQPKPKKPIRIDAPSRTEAEIWLQWRETQFQQLADDSGRCVEVWFPGCSFPFRIDPEAIGNQSGATPRPPWHHPVISSAIDLDWNAIFSGQNPIYINDLKTQRNLYLNDAAVLAQSRKPAAELLSDNAHSLNFDDELMKRCDRISQDGSLREYEYEALRWFHNPEMGRFVRKRMRLISNFWRVQYLHSSCWCGEVLQAEEVRSYGDVV